MSGRNDDPAKGGSHGHDCLADLPEVPGNEFLLEFQAHQEEEDRQQPVGRPGSDAQVKVPGFIAEGEVPEREVAFRRRRVGPDEGGYGGDEQQNAAHGFLAQDFPDAQVLPVAVPSEKDRGCPGRLAGGLV